MSAVTAVTADKPKLAAPGGEVSKMIDAVRVGLKTLRGEHSNEYITLEKLMQKDDESKEYWNTNKNILTNADKNFKNNPKDCRLNTAYSLCHPHADTFHKWIYEYMVQQEFTLAQAEKFLQEFGCKHDAHVSSLLCAKLSKTYNTQVEALKEINVVKIRLPSKNDNRDAIMSDAWPL
eukprot:gene2786-3579_t